MAFLQGRPFPRNRRTVAIVWGVGLTAFAEFITWPTPLYLVLGTTIGMLFGILPGLGGPQVLALLIPVSQSMSSTQAVALFAGAMGAIAFSGSISAILINTPGTTQSAATMFDGYQLTRQGKAGMALGAAATSSFLGALFGAIVLTLILPVGRSVVLAFSYPEYFMLAVMGLAVIAVVSQGSVWKGVTAAFFGLGIAAIGYDPVTGAARYSFEIAYLWSGIRLVPALIGMFAIAEAVEVFLEKGTIAKEPTKDPLRGVLSGVKAVFQNFGLFIRSSLIGTFIGIIPGVGGAVANFIAYIQCVATSKDRESFGKGNIRGVIAPEAANDAKDGGALVPTLIFGIPGSLEMAVLLGALIVHGIQPGPRLMLDNPGIALVLIYALVISNLITSIMGIVAAKYLIRVTTVPTEYVGALVISVALMGAYATHGQFNDVIVAVIFGLIGIAMKRFGFSRVAFLIALMLGGLAERTFWQTMMSSGGAGFFTRPISIFLLVITVVILILPYVQRLRMERQATGE